MAAAEKHVLVIANETVAGRSLIEAIERRRKDGPVRVTVITPVNQPREGYVVYEDTRRAAAGRRLEQTLSSLRAAGMMVLVALIVITAGFAVLGLSALSHPG